MHYFCKPSEKYDIFITAEQYMLKSKAANNLFPRIHGKMWECAVCFQTRKGLCCMDLPL